MRFYIYFTRSRIKHHSSQAFIWAFEVPAAFRHIEDYFLNNKTGRQVGIGRSILVCHGSDRSNAEHEG